LSLDVHGSITLPTIGDVEDAIQGKQNELTGGTNISIVDDVVSCDLTGSTYIDITDGVISATGLQNELTGGTNITISSDVVSCDLVGSTNIDITDGVISTTGLATTTQLGTKQDTITTDTDLSCNSLNTTQSNVDNSEYFDTIVIRRVSASGVLHFRELQLWVNGVNVLPSYTIPTSASNNTSTNVAGNELGETIEFFDDGTTRSGLPVGNITYRASNIANEIIDIDEGYDCVGYRDSSLYIPLNTTINMNEVQAIVFYNRFDSLQERAIGFDIELYNRSNDPNLETPLSSTNEITTANNVYRYDFPSIDTYSGSFSDTDSISQIASDTLALTEVVSEFAESANITGGLKVDTITTTGNVNVGGVLNTNNPFFHYYNGSNITINNTYLNYNVKVIDNYDAMDTTTGAYTIPKDGKYYFVFTITITSNSSSFGKIYNNDIQINGRDEFSVNGANWSENSFFAYSQCSQGGIIEAFATTGRLQTGNNVNYFTGYMVQ